MIYTNDNPSPEYIKLSKDYKFIHKTGTANKAPKDTYNGRSTIHFAEVLKKIIDKNNCKTLLDYGSGKGDRYDNKSFSNEKEYPPLKDFWNIKPTLFDPGVPYPKPKKSNIFDIVVSIDVLEHIPQQDLSWVIDEIFEYSKNIVFINVACYPAIATLPNSKNAHVSLFHPWWWCGFITAIANKYNKKAFLVCTHMVNNKRNYLSYAINDDFNNYK